MGLDVYLKKCPDRAAADLAEEAQRLYDEELWAADPKKYEQYSEAEKDAIHEKSKAFAASLGLDEWGSSPTRETVEIDSATYPQHMFKIGYFRSSYNGGGFNSYMHRLGLPSLYDIFEHDFHDMVEGLIANEDWPKALANVQSAIEKYRAIKTGQYGGLDVMHIETHNPLSGKSTEVDDENKAMEVFKKVLPKYGQPQEEPRFGDGFSNNKGEFYPDGVQVVGFIGGVREFLGRIEPCVYAVYKRQDADIEQDYYFQALKIVEETIQYVLAQPDKEQYYLSWSG